MTVGRFLRVAAARTWRLIIGPPDLTFRHRLTRFIRGLMLFFGVGHLVYAVLLIWLPVWVTPLMVSRWFAYWGTDTKIYKKWTPLDQISSHMKEAVICSEDHLFDQHFGFDIDAIKKAIEHNKKSKRKRGASTISQQVAKNVFLWQSRSWLRKGLEVYFTLLIETLWSKQRILEVYLNVAETGKGIFGVSQAARIYFNTTPDKITREQAALIAAVLPNPIEYNVNAPSARIIKRKNWILRQMRIYELDTKYMGEQPK